MAAVAAPSRKIKVGILGATGAVGQRFVQLLARSSMVRGRGADRVRQVGGQGVRGGR